MTGRRAGPARGEADRAGASDWAGADKEAGPDDYANRVLDVVDAIAPGTVMSYGDVAEFLGLGGPRQVGRVMATWGGGVAWWRVVHADGSLLAGHERAALARYEEEKTPLRRPPGGTPGST